MIRIARLTVFLGLLLSAITVIGDNDKTKEKAKNNAKSIYKGKYFNLNQSTDPGTYIARDYIDLTDGFETNSDFNAYIDQDIHVDLIFEEDNTPFDPTSYKPDKSLSVGAIEGSVNVSPSGAGTYSIPIKTIPGIKGMQPSISINYSSQSGMGKLGQKWDLGGLMAITKGNATYYHDKLTDPVDFDASDKFYLNGQRMVCITGNYGSYESYYYVEGFANLKIQYKKLRGRNYFIAKDASGKTYEFGVTDNSAVTVGNLGGLVWRLNKVYDRNGNYIEYIYKEFGQNEFLISEILYTGNSNSGHAPTNVIKFHYEKIPEKKGGRSYFYFLERTQKENLLGGIDIISHDTRLFTYRFNYIYDDFTQKLVEVSLKNSAGEAYNSTHINWTNDNYLAKKDDSTKDRNDAVEVLEVNFGDFDGDGVQDLCQRIRISGDEDKIQIKSYANDHNSQLLVDFKLNSKDRSFYVTPDLDGNGKSELIQIHTQGMRIQELENGKLVTKATTNIIRDLAGLIIGDFDGDSKTDIISINQHDAIMLTHFKLGSFNFEQKTLVGPEIVDLKEDYKHHDDAFLTRSAIVNDFDNDGKKDILMPNTSGNSVYTRLITFKVTSSNQVETSTIWPSDLGIYGGVLNENLEVDPHFGDIDGDGTLNLMLHETVNKGDTKKTYSNYWIFDGKYFIYDNQKVFPEFKACADFNNDGLVDLVVHKESKREKNNDQFIEFPLAAQWNEKNPDYIPFDTILDGKYRKVVFRKETEATRSYKLFIMYNLGNIEFSDPVPLDIEVTGSSDFDVIVSDVSGDASPEIIIKKATGWLKVNRGVYRTSLLVNTITDGIGNTVGFDYGLMKDKDLYKCTAENTANYWYLKSDLILVKKLYSNKYGPLKPISNYVYNNAVLIPGGKGFLGFEKVINKDLVQNVLTENNSSLVLEKESSSSRSFYQCILVPDHTTTYIGSTKIKQVDYDYDNLHRWHNLRSVSLQPKYITTTDFLSGTKTIEEASYDNIWYFAKVKTNKVYDTFNNNRLVSEKTSVVNYYSPNETSWWFPYWIKNNSETKKRISSSDLYTSITAYTYDNNGCLKTRNTIPNTSYPEIKINETFSDYDEYGNFCRKDESNGKQTKSFKYKYDPSHRFIKEEEIEDGWKIKKEYDLYFGLKVKETDINGLTEHFTFNKWGDLIEHKASNGNKTYYSTNWFDKIGQNDVVFYAQRENKVSGWSRTYINRQQQQIRKEEEGFDNQIIKTDIIYDNLGRVYKQSLPFSGAAPQYFTTTEYDNLNRVNRIISHNDNISNISYNNRKVTSEINVVGEGPDEAGYKKYLKKDYNSLGELITVEETLNGKTETTTYEYNVYGKPKKVILPNNSVVKLGYNGIGMREWLLDPNMADTLITKYDAWGRLKTKTDPNGNLTTNTYDHLDRLTTSIIKNSSQQLISAIEYKYTDKLPGYSLKGLIGEKIYTDEDGNTFTTKYKFNKYGQTTNVQETTPDKQFNEKYTYLSNGLLNTYTYPGGFSIKYSYDNTGNPSEIVDANDLSYSIWKAKDVNVFGKITRLEANNSSIKSEWYFDNKGLLTGQKAKYNSSIINNWYYHFSDQTGNLLSRTDIKNNLYQKFVYDEMDRLREGVQGNVGIGTLTTFLSMEYNEEGNITSKIIGDKNLTYTYNATSDLGKRPHAVGELEINPSEGFYLQDLKYNSFNLATQIEVDNKKMSIIYRNGKSRYKTSEYIDGELTKTKYFAFGNYEEICEVGKAVRKIYYIPLSGGITAIYEENSGNSGNYKYVFSDYLGNMTELIDANGNELFSHRFSPWGNPIHPSTGLLLSNDEINESNYCYDRGFTGHEHLFDYGLINMNGRLYDPLQSRFLSLDPFVQTPEGSQNFNRYTYCLNNPLKYSDPSGEFFTSLFLGPVGFYIDAALWSGTANLISNWSSIDNLGEGFALFGAGALQGAVTFACPIAGSLASGVTGAVNHYVKDMKDWNDISNVKFDDALKSGLTETLTSLASAGLGKVLVNKNVVNNILDKTGIKSSGTRNIIGPAIIGGINGFATGAVKSTVEGAVSGNWDNYFENTLRSTIYGFGAGAAVGSVNQLGFEIYKRTRNTKIVKSTVEAGKGVDQTINGLNSGAQGSENPNSFNIKGANNAAEPPLMNSIEVIAHPNGYHDVIGCFPKPILGARPVLQYYHYSYYEPTLYQKVFSVLAIRVN